MTPKVPMIVCDHCGMPAIVVDGQYKHYASSPSAGLFGCYAGPVDTRHLKSRCTVNGRRDVPEELSLDDVLNEMRSVFEKFARVIEEMK